MENQLQLVIKTPMDNFPAMIEFNFTELQQALKNALQAYQGIAYTVDAMRTAKADRATLNKLKRAIEAERRSVKAVCMKPYEDFDAKTKQLLAMIDEPVTQIDVQIKKYEAEQRSFRRQHLEDFYNTAAGDLKDNIPFEKIYQESWTNATANVKAVETILVNAVESFYADIKTIEAKCGEFAVPCKSIYYKTLNLNQAMAEETRLQHLKAQEQAKAAQKAAEAQKAAQQQEINAAVPDPQPFPPPVTEAPAPADIPETGDPLEQEPAQEAQYEVTFTVTATYDQLMALRAFLKDNGINFRKA